MKNVLKNRSKFFCWPLRKNDDSTGVTKAKQVENDRKLLENYARSGLFEIQQQLSESDRVDLKFLIDSIRLVEKYESKNELYLAISLCESILRKDQNGSKIQWFQLAVKNKLKHLTNEMTKTIEQTQLAKKVKQCRAIDNNSTIEFVITSLRFIEQLRDTRKEIKQLGYDYLKFLCNQRLQIVCDHLDRARLLDCLAYSCVENDEFEKAIKLSNEAIESRIHSACGDEHREMLISLSTKSYAFYSLENFVETIKLIERSLEIKERILDQNHLLFKIELNNLDLVLNLCDKESFEHLRNKYSLEENRSDLSSNSFYLTQLNDFY